MLWFIIIRIIIFHIKTPCKCTNLYYCLYQLQSFVNILFSDLITRIIFKNCFCSIFNIGKKFKFKRGNLNILPSLLTSFYEILHSGFKHCCTDILFQWYTRYYRILFNILVKKNHTNINGDSYMHTGT